MIQSENDIFHVHTYRCGHAEEIEDAIYIEKAIGLGASSIWFLDHVPFPGDTFRHRMKIRQLLDYISDLDKLKRKYKNDIAVHIGLEAEFLPSFVKYYEGLRTIRELEILAVGQHFFEVSSGEYSYNLPADLKKASMHCGCIVAMIEAMSSGLFDIVLHPDRAFRYIKNWTENEDILVDTIKYCASKYEVSLEYNLSSKDKNKRNFDHFWKGDTPLLVGLDAHSLQEMVAGYEKQKEIFGAEL